MRSKKGISSIILFIVFLLSNFIWYKLYLREHNKLTHATIPSLAEDYFTTQKVLTKYRIYSEANSFISNFGGVVEFQSEKPSIYSIYFSTEEDYLDYIKTHENIKDIPLIQQNPEYPNGCEPASAVMFLQSIGINISLKEFVDSYLDTDSVYESHGNRFGPNPSISYAGDPASETRGWGALQPVISNAIAKVIEQYDNQFFAQDKFIITNDNQNIPLYFIAALNNPAVIWITQDYKESNEVYEWFSYDKKYTYTYPKKSHTVLLTGMDENYYYINDPLKGQANITVPKEQLEKAFDSMGRQFISII